jgi:threonine dehydrogenase-like Zn-dependent dehydrogenase
MAAEWASFLGRTRRKLIPTKPMSMMQAAVLEAPGRASVRKMRVPDVNPGEVRVRLEGCGVCGSNLAPWEGRPWFQYPFDAGKPGHEGWGWIDEVGTGVTQFRRGDRVALLSYHAFAEFDVAPADSVVLLPPSLVDKPFPGEALGCAMNVFRRCQIQPGEAVAIVGVGFLGTLLLALAASRQAQIIAISRRDFALDTAREFGAHRTLRMGEVSSVIDAVKRITGGRGCDCVIEAAGCQQTLDLATELTRERGRLVIAGYHQDGPRTVNMQLWNWRGLDVINAHERDPHVYVSGMKEAAEAIACGKIDPAPLYTHEFPLDEIGNAFTAMKERPNHFLKAFVRI